MSSRGAVDSVAPGCRLVLAIRHFNNHVCAIVGKCFAIQPVLCIVCFGRTAESRDRAQVTVVFGINEIAVSKIFGEDENVAQGSDIEISRKHANADTGIGAGIHGIGSAVGE